MKFGLLVALLLVVAGLLQTDAQAASPSGGVPAAATPAPAGAPVSASTGNIDITSDAMTVVSGSRLATASGHVHARGSTFEAWCDHGEVTYTEAARGHRTIELMVLQDHVKLHRFSDGLVSESAVATYMASTREVVLKGGDPVATRGEDILHGDEMTVSLDTNAMHVIRPRAEIIRKERADPLHIDADELKSTEGGKHLHFERNVRIHDATMNASSDRMDADVDNPCGAGDTSQVSRMVLLGHVVAHQQDEDATAGRATYQAGTGNWVLTENPVVTQAGQTVKGDRIVIEGNTGRALAYRADVTLPVSQARDGGSP
jgi:lipopolysaccharide transport protein LptA